MISRFRLKLDSWVQICLAMASIGCGLATWYVPALSLLWILWLWQTGSALELWLDYRHHSRRPYLWLAPLLFLVGLFFRSGILLLMICVLVYIWHTLRDYQIVRRRPRSFWEL